MKKLIIISLLNLLLSLLLWQCSFSIFQAIDEVDGSDGRSGDINQWIEVGHDYYSGGTDAGYESAEIILENLAKYRWKEMTTDQKIEVSIFLSKVVANKHIEDNSSFLSNTAALFKTFESSKLTFNTGPTDDEFVNKYIEMANNFHLKAQSHLYNIIPYSNEVSPEDSDSILIHTASSFMISYAYFGKNELSGKSGNLGKLNYAYSIAASNERIAYSNHLVYKTNKVDIISNAFYSSIDQLCLKSTTDPSFYYRSNNSVMLATNAENNLGPATLGRYSNFMRSTAKPDLGIINNLTSTNRSLLKNSTKSLYEFSYFIEDYINNEERTAFAKKNCFASGIYDVNNLE